MAEVDKAILDTLDGMALKIVLIEPGDLSLVGEILDHLEKILRDGSLTHHADLKQMAAIMKQVLEKIIMAELDDSAENYERIGECVALMQEVARNEGIVEGALRDQFCLQISRTGYLGRCQDLFLEASQDEEETGAGANVGHSEQEEEQQDDGGPSEILPETTLSGPTSEMSAALSQPVCDEPMIEQNPEEFLQDTELLSGFIDESLEHLETIEANVLELEHNPGDPEIINNIFRPFHTIKGVSAFLNLKAINTLSHSIENLLDDVRNGDRPMDSAVIDIVLGVGDFLRSMIENIKDVLEGGTEKYKALDIRDFIRRINEIQSGATVQPSALTSKEEEVGPGQPEKTASPGGFSSDAETIETGEEEEEGQGLSQKRTSPVARVGGGKLDASIKVNIEKLDALVNAVGELVIMQSLVQENPQIRNIVDPKLSRDFSQLSRITSELQKTAMSMRMVPIRQTFQKMVRLVRDLSKKSGKMVDLLMEGEETEIDRNMVDSIYDPLVHMIRNSVDHGVQVPEEREKCGKPSKGTVSLRAYQKGGNMVIEIEDDGNGLNSEKIRQKAIERGLIQAEDNISEHELNNLIFVPGFSTAETITDVSGRGVGMDVVKRGVERLRGKVEVFSEPDNGSKFIIKLPLTLAIIDGIIVRVGGERYIIPTVAIKESLKVQKKNYNTVYGKGEAILLRESLVPIIRLYSVFNVDASHRDPCEAILVVVEHEGRQRALMVDEVLGKQEVVIKNLGGLLSDIKGVAGGTILGDGRVGLILDLAGLMATTDDGSAVVGADTAEELI